jgi:hypothetical protein
VAQKAVEIRSEKTTIPTTFVLSNNFMLQMFTVCIHNGNSRSRFMSHAEPERTKISKSFDFILATKSLSLLPLPPAFFILSLWLMHA